MNTISKGGIFTLTTTLLLTIAPLVSAETPRRSIGDSQILPYLLNQTRDNSWVRVRCISKSRQEQNSNRHIIRDSLLNSHAERHDTVTIEIEGSCRHVRIRLEDDFNYFDQSVDDSDFYDQHTGFEDGWLTRDGSGWHWLLQNQR